MEKVCVLIPAYEPDEKLLGLIHKGIEGGVWRFLVVNDGSSRSCLPIFDEIRSLGITVLAHEANRGKGAALKTGLQYILDSMPDCVGAVTADADGQHTVEDILKVSRDVAEHPESLVLGVRAFDKDEVPWTSRAGNAITATVFKMMTGIRVRDTQTGLRGIPRDMIDSLLKVDGDRYEFEMNCLLDAAAREVPILQEPIETVYIEGNKSSHFRFVRDSFLIYRRPLTFLGMSLTSTAVDLILFHILADILFGGNEDLTFTAYVIARIISGSVNFLLHKNVTFKSHGNGGQQTVRYIALFLGIMVTSAAIVSLLVRVLPIPKLIIKMAVDGALFFANYHFQKVWVFKEQEKE